jgi:hypothetical protein
MAFFALQHVPKSAAPVEKSDPEAQARLIKQALFKGKP